MKTNQKEIGQRIKAILDKVGMTQRALAEKLEVTDPTVSAYIRGTAAVPTEVLILVAKLGNISLGWLITGQEEQPSTDQEELRSGDDPPQTIFEQIGPGYGPEVKLMADYLEVKIKGKTAEERLRIVEELMADIRSKYK